METLPQQLLEAPRLYVWPCEHCGHPSDLWHWGDRMPPGPGARWDRGDDFPPVLCSNCFAELNFPEQKEARRTAFQYANLRIRKHADLPAGTIIWCPEDQIEDRDPRRKQQFTGEVFAVVVANLDPIWLFEHDILDEFGWIEWPYGGVLVFLGGFAQAGADNKGRDIPAGYLILRSLQRPSDPPSCELVPSGAILTGDQRKRVDAARGAFLRRRDPRGRPPGSGRFETATDFEVAVFAAVAALWKQKRKITEGTIGAHLVAKRGRNATRRERAGDSPGDPARQFREWCVRFRADPRDLIARARVACDAGE